MSNQLATTTKLLTASEVADLITAGNNNYLTAARAIVANLDVNPGFRASMIAEGVLPQVVDQLEAIGRGQRHPSLCMCTASYATAVARLPMSQQREVLENGVEVLDADETSIRNIPAAELSAQQQKQVFSGASVRTIAQQRTFIREKKAKILPVDETASYKVDKHGVQIVKPGHFSWKLLAQWQAMRDA
jgi:hypothetical protein